MANLAVGQTILYVNVRNGKYSELKETTIEKIGRKYLDTTAHSKVNLSNLEKSEYGNIEAIFFYDKSHYEIWIRNKLEIAILAKLNRGLEKMATLQEIAKVLNLEI